MKYPVTIVLAATALIAATPQTAPTPPPAPPNVTQPSAAAPSTAPVLPAATPTPNTALQNLLGPPGPAAAPKRGATPSPPPDTRKGLDGVWELQIQRGDKTTYDHFNLKQTGNTITGTYLDNQKNKRYPLSGSVDGEQIRMVVSMPDGSTILMQGKLDGTTDMLGMYTNPKENVPFTAAYRPKEKWIDNLNANPGLGGIGTGTTGGNGLPPQ